MLDLAAAAAAPERGRGGPTGGTGHRRRPDEMAMRKTLLRLAPRGGFVFPEPPALAHEVMLSRA